MSQTPVVRYSYNPKSRRYHDNVSKQFVSAKQVRLAVDTVIDAETQKIRDLATALTEGKMRLADWQTQTATLLKTLHVAMGVAANGGFASTSQADYGYMGSLIKKQYAFLRDFAAQIASGEQPLDGSLVARAALYTQAARGVYSDTLSKNAQDAGQAECRRIPGGSDHCNGCLEEVARGWVPIDDALPIGGAECRSNCRCSQEFR